MCLGEIAYRLGFQVTHTLIGASIEKHLHDGRQVVGVAKEPCVTRHAAKHGGCLVVHITPKLLHAKDGVVFGGSNLVAGEVVQRLKADV